jgi:D-alanyl-D-alanine carboxypeptidase
VAENLMKNVLVFLALLLPGLVAAQVPTPERPTAMPTPAAPQLGARSYILMDFNSNRVLAERDPDQRSDIASMTKLMTGYVVFKELQSGNATLQDIVPVSENAWRTGGSRMFIEPDMEVTLEQMLLGMIVQSGNDASVAMAEYLAGSEPAFAEVMNFYARELGMTNSNFVNATGLPDEITTALLATWRCSARPSSGSFPGITPGIRRRSSLSTAFASTTATTCSGVIRQSMASRPVIRKLPAIALPPAPGMTACG